MMLRYCYLFLLVLLFACQNERSKQTADNTKPNQPQESPTPENVENAPEKIHIDTTRQKPKEADPSFDYAASLEEALPEWIAYQTSRNTEFSPKQFKFSHEAPLKPQTKPFKAESDFWELYKNALPAAPSKPLHIDIYTKHLNLQKQEDQIKAQLSPDKEVALINTAKNQRLWLLFFGSSTYLDDAYWLNNQEFLMVGGIDTPQGKYQPMAWYINLEKSFYQAFAYKATLSHEAHYYLQEKFDSISFQSL